MIRSKIWPVALPVFALLLVGGAPVRGQIEIDIVALTGEYAHGGGGGQFSTFDRPVLNAGGDVAFRAWMNPGFGGVTETNKTGIWRKRPHTHVHKIARAGDRTTPFKPYGSQPEVTAARHGTIGEARIGPDGRVTFLSHLALPSEDTFIGAHNNEIIWSMKELTAGSLDVTQEKGSKAPMVRIDPNSGQQTILDAAGKRTWFHVLRPPKVMPDGAVVFTASLQLNGLDGKSGIWFFRKPPGQDPAVINPSFVLIEDAEPIPGAPAGASFREFSALTLTPSDTCVFHAFLDVGVGSVTDGNAEGIWKKQVGGSLQAVAVAGSAASGVGGHLWSELGKPVANPAADIAFRATLLKADPSDPTEHREGIWFFPNTGSPSPVALEGQQAPGFPDGTVFDAVSDPALAADGRVAFAATVRDDAFSNSKLMGAIYAKTPSGLALIARSGNSAPGTGGATFQSFGSPMINGTGQLAFSAELSPSPDFPGGHGLWATTPSGALGAIAVTGTAISLPNGGSRSVQWLEATEMNTGGQLALRIRFDDGTEAVAMASTEPPEPPEFGTWAESNVPDPAERGPTDDPDKDAIPNFLELAFGGDPMSPDPSRAPSSAIGKDPSNGDSTLELLYFELSNPGALRYAVEASSNLFMWSPTATVEIGRTLQNDGTYLVRVRELNPPDEAPGRFLRVRVTDS